MTNKRTSSPAKASQSQPKGSSTSIDLKKLAVILLNSPPVDDEDHEFDEEIETAMKLIEAYAQSLLSAKLSELLEKLDKLNHKDWKYTDPYDNPDIRQGYHECLEDAQEAIEKMLEEL